MNTPPTFVEQAQTETPSPKPLPPTVKLLGCASLLNDIASEMVYTQLPLFVTQVLGGNKLHVGLMEGAADTTASLLKLWSGAKSDQTGRRKGMVVFGYAVAALTRPIIAFVTGPWQLLGLRIADRVGKGVRASPRDAMIADVTDADSRGQAFGFHRGMDHLGAAIGPLLALAFLFFWPDQLRTLFFLSIVPGIAVTLLALALRETPEQNGTGPICRNDPEGAARELDRSRFAPFTLQPFGSDFRWFLVALLIFTLGNSTDAFLLLRAEELGVPKVWLPALWCLFHIAKSSGNVLAGRLVDRVGPRPLLFAGWLLYAVVYLLFGLATTAWHAWALFLAYAVFYALVEPAEKTLVANLVGSDRKGLAFGWFNLVIGIGALPASMLFGVLYERGGALTAFGTGAGLALVATLLLAWRSYGSRVSSNNF